MRVLDSSGKFISPQAWDAFVCQDPRGHLLQTWAWGELKKGFGWFPLRLLITADGAPIAGAQVLYRQLGPLRIAYIPKGPILAQEDPQAISLLWEAIHQRSRRLRAILLKVEPEWYAEETWKQQELSRLGFKPSFQCIQPRRTIIVDLSPQEEEILARMKPKWRYNIRLSFRKGVQVRQGGLKDLPIFYRLMRITGERDGFGIHSEAYYRRALELFGPDDRVALFLAYYQEEPLAGLMAFAFNGSAWYMYGASSNKHRSRMPNHQLQWQAMLWAKGKGCQKYDLWGITDESSPGSAALAGVERFKAGFGGKTVRYIGAYDYIYSKPLYWLLQKAWAWRQRS